MTVVDVVGCLVKVAGTGARARRCAVVALVGPAVAVDLQSAPLAAVTLGGRVQDGVLVGREDDRITRRALGENLRSSRDSHVTVLGLEHHGVARGDRQTSPLTLLGNPLAGRGGVGIDVLADVQAVLEDVHAVVIQRGKGDGADGDRPRIAHEKRVVNAIAVGVFALERLAGLRVSGAGILDLHGARRRRRVVRGRGVVDCGRTQNNVAAVACSEPGGQCNQSQDVPVFHGFNLLLNGKISCLIKREIQRPTLI